MLLHMLPRLAFQDTTDRGRFNTVAPSQGGLRHTGCVVGSNGSHGLFCQIGHAVGFTALQFLRVCARSVAVAGCATTAGATLREHVAVVVGQSAKKQVVRIATRRIVAAMARIQAIWNWTVYQFPRDAVRLSRRSSWNPEQSVPFVRGAGPEPARRAEHGMNRSVLVHLRPEPIGRWNGLRGDETHARTKPVRPFRGHRPALFAGVTWAFLCGITTGPRAMTCHLARSWRSALLTNADESLFLYHGSAWILTQRRA